MIPLRTTNLPRRTPPVRNNPLFVRAGFALVCDSCPGPPRYEKHLSCVVFATLEVRKMSMMLPILISGGVVVFLMVLFAIGLMQERVDTAPDDKPAAPDSTSSE